MEIGVFFTCSPESLLVLTGNAVSSDEKANGSVGGSTVCKGGNVLDRDGTNALLGKLPVIYVVVYELSEGKKPLAVALGNSRL